MGANISAWRGDGGSHGSNTSDGNPDSPTAASVAPVDPGSLYFGTRLFVSQPRAQEEDGDEEAGRNPAAASADGELSALEVLRRVNNTAPFHQTKTLNCPINLKKQSLSLIAQSSDDKQHYSVQFMFDACTSCAITVFYACVEVYDKDNRTYKFVPVDAMGKPRADPVSSRRIFMEPGLQQVFLSRFGEELDVSMYPPEHLLQFARPATSASLDDDDDASERKRDDENGAEGSDLLSLNEVDGEDSSRSAKKRSKKNKKTSKKGEGKRQRKEKSKKKKKKSKRSKENKEDEDDGISTELEDRSVSASSLENSNDDSLQSLTDTVDADEIVRHNEEDDAEEDADDEEEPPAVFPIVILIEPILPNGATSATVMPGFTVSAATRRVQGLATYATLLKTSDGNYEIKPLRQKLFFDGVPYVVHDIYGLDSDSGGVQQECVICMTENRDTVVLPCRHMCLCHQCAEIMKADTLKCPICRGAVRALMKVEVSKGVATDQETPLHDLDRSEESEEGEEIELVKRPRQQTAKTTPDDSSINLV